MYSLLCQFYLALGMVAASQALAAATAPYACFDFEVPMSFQAISMKPSFAPFQNHYEAVSILEKLTSRNRSEYPPLVVDPQNVTVNVTIAAQYCSPRENANGIVQVLTHGLGFDHQYWTWGGNNSQYNYVKVATEAGYSTLLYDRIGVGKSTKSDPYTINQYQIEAQVLAILTTHLRQRDIAALKNIPAPRKVVHVGHSYGSRLSVAMAANDPTLSDGIVLTGFSNFSTTALQISSNFHLAKENIPSRYGNLSTGYLTWADELANQFGFFHFPNFSTDVLAEAEQKKWPFSIGEMLTASVTPVASKFKGPVLALSGQFDVLFCQDDCRGLLEQSRGLFPAAQPYETYIQPDTGHGLNLHFNASAAYQVIQNFFEQGQFENALQIERQMMEIRKTKSGADHADTLHSLSHIALYYRKMHRWTESEELEVQVLEANKASLGLNNTSVLFGMASLAKTVKELGRDNEAIQLMRESIERLNQVLGPGNPQTRANQTLLYEWEREATELIKGFCTSMKAMRRLNDR